MTAPAVTRTLSIFYDSFEVGGSTVYHLDGPMRHERTLTEARLSFGVLVQETTDAAFATSCAAVEAAFRKRDVRLRVVLNSQTYPDYNPSTNTGFEQIATCVQGNSPNADTAYSRRYDVTIVVQLPTPDLAGLLDVNVAVEYDPAKTRTVTIRGTYLADGGSDATANYAASIDAKCTSLLSAVASGGTFERVHELTDRDRVDKKIHFERTYLEVIFAQTGSGLDHASIVQHIVGIERVWEQPGDSGGGSVRRLEQFRLRYSCWLDKTVTTDTASMLTGTIIPYLKSLFTSRYSPSVFGILSEDHQHLPATNQLVGELRILAAIGASSLIESVVTVSIREEAGLTLTHPWDGQQFSAFKDYEKATRLRITRSANRVLGTVGARSHMGGGSGGGGGGGGGWGGAGVLPGVGHIGIGPGGSEIVVPGGPANGSGSGGDGGAGGGGAPGGGGGGGSWVFRGSTSDATNLWIGQPGQTIAVTDLIDVITEEWVTEPAAAGAGPTVTESGDAPPRNGGSPPVTEHG